LTALITSLNSSSDHMFSILAASAPDCVVDASSDDMFSILAASGPDCVGDVFVSLSSKPDSTRTQQPLEDSDSVSFHDLFERSISSPEYSVRLQDSSVPGIHPKLSAEMISFPLTVKKRKKRYILKLAPAKFPKLVENEFFFTQMARACGINAAESKIIHDKTGQSGLLVERFDRYYDEQTKQILSIHQEDACQFLDRYPQDKYRLPMRSIANGLKLYCTAPVLEIGKLIALKAFSYLILNGDLHAKNISIVSEPRTERIVLSPAYDLVSTLPYGNNQMALEFEGRRDNLKLRDFISFGAAFGVRDKAVRAIIEDLRSAARPFVDRLSEIGLDSKQTAHLRREMLERLKDLD
ncbi:MAG: HipA domain-containing protein, partial [Bdellovibrionales bacterium]|nr:HipA domain-containing protein [Bdellovibrionales bacterium]